MRDLIVGTAGHIDHGKTTLLKALTGIDTDRLEEEKRRGITIDLGFAHLQLGNYRIGFIDVPGHERFVKNMLAGIGGIHLVLLVVAADESVMPQTVEHFQICRLLQIQRGIIVLTKKNSIEPELLPLVEEEVRELVKGSFLESAPVVAVDSLSGEGIEQLKKVMLQELENVHPHSSPQIFRLPIDRVFTVRGFGTVVTGTLYSGELWRDDPVAVYPSGKEGKVRGIQIFNQKAERAIAGQRTALNLSGFEKEELERGMVLSRPRTFRACFFLDALVQLLPGSPELKQRSPIRFHCGSGEFLGKVYLMEGEQLDAGKSALAQVRLDSPVLCCPKDSFILRRYSPLTTVGGGVILDNAPQKLTRHNRVEALSKLKTLLEKWQEKSDDFDAALLKYCIETTAHSAATMEELVARTGFTPAYLREQINKISGVTLITPDPLVVAASEKVKQAQTFLLDLLQEFHHNNSLGSGMSREELKEKVVGNAPYAYFQYLLTELERLKKIQLSSTFVSLYGQQVELTPSQVAIKEQVLSRVHQGGWHPPTLEELLTNLNYPGETIRDVFYYLIQRGELVRLSSDLVLAPEKVEQLKEQLTKSFPRGQTFSVTEFKDLFQLTRKYAIPYLEFLDREHVTRRIGDKRMVL
ncbi:MAG: selenocysteine-specific translation elongation factor [Acidobacteria bacterium]|nr:selenocysteine-specific translation elongation factor [Acidobacteriota bacterium]